MKNNEVVAVPIDVVVMALVSEIGEHHVWLENLTNSADKTKDKLSERVDLIKDLTVKVTDLEIANQQLDDTLEEFRTVLSNLNEIVGRLLKDDARK